MTNIQKLYRLKDFLKTNGLFTLEQNRIEYDIEDMRSYLEYDHIPSDMKKSINDYLDRCVDQELFFVPCHRGLRMTKQAFKDADQDFPKSFPYSLPYCIDDFMDYYEDEK